MAKKQKSGYKIATIIPHPYLKYQRDEFEDVFSTRKAALQQVGKFTSGSIVDSERWVKRKGIDGPVVIEISKGKDIWHVEFVIKKGAFNLQMTHAEELVAEEWLESGAAAAKAQIATNAKRKKN